MNNAKYKVMLTNGKVLNEYLITAHNEQSAIILAQAEAINLARGYDFVSIEEV